MTAGQPGIRASSWYVPDATHVALPPWANAGADGRTVIRVAFGGYVLLALDAYLGDRPLRHEELAAKITRLLYRGMAG